MKSNRKKILYTVILLVSVSALCLYGKNNIKEAIRIEGVTMGTSYHITYFDSKGRNFKQSVDSLLRVVTKSINVLVRSNNFVLVML